MSKDNAYLADILDSARRGKFNLATDETRIEHGFLKSFGDGRTAADEICVLRPPSP